MLLITGSNGQLGRELSALFSTAILADIDVLDITNSTTPTNAADLARAIADILPRIQSGIKEIYHYTNEGVTSWYDFAREIMELSSLKCQVVPIESRDYPTKTVRPFYSVLNKSKIKKHFGVKIPHWKESLKQCLKQF